MKRMNKKGFTLIELLAVIIIMGVLLLVAVPSVSKYITSSRIDTYNTNLTRIVDAVKTELNSYSNSDYSFSTNEVLLIPLHCIELESGNTKKSPFSNYIPKSSFILVDRKVENGVPVGFTYYITAVDESGYGSAFNTSDKVSVGVMSSAYTIKYDPNTETYSVVDSKDNVPSQFKKKTFKLLGNCTL